MVPTRAEGATLVLDEPIPEIDAEIDAEVDGGIDVHAPSTGHDDFLRAVRALMHGGEVNGHTGTRPADGQSADPAVPEDALSDPLPGLELTPRTSRRSRRRDRATTPGTTRRERRREKAFARAVARAATEDIAPTAARDQAVETPRADETLGEYLARVEAPRLARRSRIRTPFWLRRTVKLGLVGVLIGGSIALPWAAPQVPEFFADLVPDGGTPVVRVEDPPVAPSSEAFVGPVGIAQQAGPYAGVRLQSAGQPREVRIQRLQVDSAVVPISGQSGTLLPPDDPQVLGWWQEGKPVGAQYGTSVITGHAVHTGGGALDDLGKLVVGDTLRVRTDNGWITYAVQRTRIYSKGALAADAGQIFRLSGPGRLVVISCDDWNGAFYESNSVVVATPVLDEPAVPEAGTEVPDVGPGGSFEDPSGNMDGDRGVLLREKYL